MIAITFQGTAPLNFLSTLSIGNWSSFTIAADPNPPGNPHIHLQQFSTTVAEITSTGPSEVMLQAAEDAGAAFLQMRLDNRSGYPLTILIPGADTITVPGQQSVDVTYNRSLVVRKY